MMPKNHKVIRRGGWKPKPLHERKVKVYGYVQQQHFVKVQKMITELIKPYR
jgi:hypothetical protein